METEDRLVIPATGAFFFPLLLLGLAGAATYSGVTTEPTLVPVGVVLIPASVFAYRSASRPLILDRNADRILGYPMELSQAQKVVVKEVGLSDGSAYVVDLVFPGRTFRLTRGSLPQQPNGPDRLAKKVGAFLGIPAEPYTPFYASFSFGKGLHLTEEQARDAGKAGYTVDPRAIK